MKKKFPDTIYLTRDGWNDCSPEDGEVLWCEDRITKHDVEYRRVIKDASVVVIAPKFKGKYGFVMTKGLKKNSNNKH